MNFPLASGVIACAATFLGAALLLFLVGRTKKINRFRDVGLVVFVGGVLIFALYSIVDRTIGFGKMSAIWIGLVASVTLGLVARAYLNRR